MLFKPYSMERMFLLKLKNYDKVDSETAIASLKKLVDDDKDWIEVSFSLNIH